VVCADACTVVAIERNHTPFVKLRRRCLHVLYDDALACSLLSPLITA
jgi:hypothetical protein